MTTALANKSGIEEAGRALQAAVDAFGAKFGAHMQADSINLPVPEVIRLRRDLILEEVKETILGLTRLQHASDPNIGLAEKKVALVEAYDGILDTVFVLLGACSALGLDFGRGFAEVCRSNMSKIPAPNPDPTKKYSGDHNPKGPGYEPPRLEECL